MSASSQLRLYIDTNIFVDHIVGFPRGSSTLLREIEQGYYRGMTSCFTLSELTAVLKRKRFHLQQSKIERIINQVKSFPNIEVVFHEPKMFLEMPEHILSTCLQAPDALHSIIAVLLKADRIVTRDHYLMRAVKPLIRCVTPEQLIHHQRGSFR